ncbi:unnamed protein product [Amoebophrya sp. A120]|nr:unnamed protein product [Amoebophrya sp. A120]|eukprot:GSA120T00008916001.1
MPGARFVSSATALLLQLAALQQNSALPGVFAAHSPAGETRDTPLLEQSGGLPPAGREVRRDEQEYLSSASAANTGARCRPTGRRVRATSAPPSGARSQIREGESISYYREKYEEAEAMVAVVNRLEKARGLLEGIRDDIRFVEQNQTPRDKRGNDYNGCIRRTGKQLRGVAGTVTAAGGLWASTFASTLPVAATGLAAAACGGLCLYHSESEHDQQSLQKLIELKDGSAKKRAMERRFQEVAQLLVNPPEQQQIAEIEATGFPATTNDYKDILENLQARWVQANVDEIIAKWKKIMLCGCCTRTPHAAPAEGAPAAPPQQQIMARSASSLPPAP